MAKLRPFLVVGCWFALWSVSAAGDWPQILGPNRNGVGTNEKFAAKDFAKEWQADCGSGLAGVAVADGLVVLFHRLGDQETLTAFDATGQQRWSTGFPCSYQASIVDDDGPRAVPTIQNGRVYAYGVQGGLYCVELKTGKILWTRATHREFQAPEGYFGAGSAPLVEGSLVIVNVGGPKGAGVVAFDSTTGKTAWQVTNELASYAAPIRVERGQKPRILVITRLNFLGLEPASGKELFRIPFGSRGPTVNGALPVTIGNQVLLTASYGIGARLVDVTADAANVTWEDEILSSQYTTPIVHEGLVYGIDGRQDGGPVSLKCFDPQTRKVLWTKSGLEYATLVAADGKLLIQQSNGELRVAALDKTAYRELAIKKLASGTTRALPALANGRWYLRNESTLFAFDLN